MTARSTRPAAVRVRRARAADVPTIAAIYNDAVRTTTATFDLSPRSLADRRRWFRDHGRRHPILVAVRGSAVVGWSSLSPWSDRPAYARTAEVSTYVAAEARGGGIGTALLAALVREARAFGHHALLARIAEGNPASRALHRSAGFRSVGRMREVGVKFGRRLDVELLELLLPDAPGEPLRRRRAAPPLGRD